MVKTKCIPSSIDGDIFFVLSPHSLFLLHKESRTEYTDILLDSQIKKRFHQIRQFSKQIYRKNFTKAYQNITT